MWVGGRAGGWHEVKDGGTGVTAEGGREEQAVEEAENVQLILCLRVLR